MSTINSGSKQDEGAKTTTTAAAFAELGLATRTSENPSHAVHRQKPLALICLGALGVVFGDIGTSPLYVYTSVFDGALEVTTNNVLGITSLIFYTVTFVVCIKYVIFVMTADFNGEGGVFALLSQILYGKDHLTPHSILKDHSHLDHQIHSYATDSASSSQNVSRVQSVDGMVELEEKHKHHHHHHHHHHGRHHHHGHGDEASSSTTTTSSSKDDNHDHHHHDEKEAKQERSESPTSILSDSDDDSPPSSATSSYGDDHHKNEKIPHRWVLNRRLRTIYIILSMVGSGLLLGDGVITPAISVLSAVEGFAVISDKLDPAIVPITAVIVLCLFMAQSYGTAKFGNFFGPIMILWFLSLAGTGLNNIISNPSVLKAFNPAYAVGFFTNNDKEAFFSLGAVVLCITGCEAMYADMGHFGTKAVRLAWLCVVYPSVLLSYFGQAAVLIENPSIIHNTFFLSIPDKIFYPMLVLSVLATIIASQALISGAFSLTSQAVALGSFPRLSIIHTSATMHGQIFIPFVNYVLMFVCILIVIGFQTSGHLASAYGVAVCGDMLLTSVLFTSLAYLRWRWHAALLIPLALLFLAVDLAFLSSNLRKVPYGGWFPLTFAAIVVIIMYTWRSGHITLRKKIGHEQEPLDNLYDMIRNDEVTVCGGTGIFMSGVGKGIPSVMSQFLEHVPVLPENTIFLTINYRHEPFVSKSESRLTRLGKNIYRMILENGYMEHKISVDLLHQVAMMHNLDVDFAKGTFYLGNEQVAPNPNKWIGHRVFISVFNFLLQFSHKSTANSFSIPDKNTIYVGSNYIL
eukprot:TRINITY_DN4481_c1_g1_i1.p1 TRINITY_DN4481_c1_g1~~TRINITY_DN4481_c1_g1_i1.p1  ORF type:complete len:801 (+),score=202.99 TRINITY_DN4481_c1_g1_i1:88-2490(+)